MFYHEQATSLLQTRHSARKQVFLKVVQEIFNSRSTKFLTVTYRHHFCKDT